jgi:hypothetical protein
LTSYYELTAKEQMVELMEMTDDGKMDDAMMELRRSFGWFSNDMT